MTVTAKDLRFKISMLFDLLSKKEDIFITYRGKVKAKLVPFEQKDDKQTKKDDRLFGLWRDKDIEVDDYVRELRKGRNFDI